MFATVALHLLLPCPRANTLCICCYRDPKAASPAPEKAGGFNAAKGKKQEEKEKKIVVECRRVVWEGVAPLPPPKRVLISKVKTGNRRNEF